MKEMNIKLLIEDLICYLFGHKNKFICDSCKDNKDIAICEHMCGIKGGISQGNLKTWYKTKDEKE